MPEFVFWQRIVSPHMTGLAQALGKLGYRVTFIAEQTISIERENLGWQTPDTNCIDLKIVKNKKMALTYVSNFSDDVIHLTQGIRGNGYIASIIYLLQKRRARWGAMMETIDERSNFSYIKRIVYKWKLKYKTQPDFILSIGEKMPAWLEARGYPSEKIFPFAYFLANNKNLSKCVKDNIAPFRFGFVGQLIPRKRLDLLIDALASINDCKFELIVIGNGQLEKILQNYINKKIGHTRVYMHGNLAMDKTLEQIALMDCLILPSDHDGWGAVVSEALLIGVPVICSDACGSAAVVRVSNQGGVFMKGNKDDLQRFLHEEIIKKRITKKDSRKLAQWSTCLGDKSGAEYLLKIVEFYYLGCSRPLPPWLGRKG